MQHGRVVVIGGGGTVPRSVLDQLPADAVVVAADGGVDAALALGLVVDVVVGDLDSATPSGLAAAEAAGASVERHPVDKDATDLALALDRAATLLDVGGETVVVGVEGGRLDHLLAGLLALGDPALCRGGRTLRAHLGPATIHVVHGPGVVGIDAAAGQLLTIVPIGGDAIGVRTDGLRYPLEGERLPAATTRGVSNVVEAEHARVGLDDGTLLVILPGERA